MIYNLPDKRWVFHWFTIIINITTQSMILLYNGNPVITTTVIVLASVLLLDCLLRSIYKRLAVCCL